MCKLYIIIYPLRADRHRMKDIPETLPRAKYVYFYVTSALRMKWRATKLVEIEKEIEIEKIDGSDMDIQMGVKY